MLSDAVSDTFRGLISDCGGMLVETLAAPVKAFQDALRLYGMLVAAENCQSMYGQPDRFIEAACRLRPSAPDCVVFDGSLEGMDGARCGGTRTNRVQHTPGLMSWLSPFAGLRPSA